MIATLNPLDWILILLIVFSAIGAFSRGIIRVLASLLGLAAGLLLASWNYLQFASWLGRWIPRGAVAEVAAFLLILVAVMVAVSFIAGILRATVSNVGLGLFDRLLGAVFGVVRGCLVATVVVLALSAFFPRSAWLRSSETIPYFLAGAHAVSFIVPEHLQRQIADQAATLLRQTPVFLTKPASGNPHERSY